MERFIQVIVDGLATGSLYGALAHAGVLFYPSTGIVYIAQGEKAMFITVIAIRSSTSPNPSSARSLALTSSSSGC